MNDLISRQAAIDMLKNRWKKTRNYEGIGDDIAEECELYLKQVPSAQPVVISKLENATECEDAVSREAVLNEIHRYMEERDYTIGLLDDNVCGLPPVTPKQPGWIPVTEKPIEGGQYIVTLKDDKEVWTDIAEWNPTFGGRWQAEFFDCEYRDIDNVVAWQPLPTPYRKGEQDE